jgi:hypothetical protein
MIGELKEEEQRERIRVATRGDWLREEGVEAPYGSGSRGVAGDGQMTRKVTVGLLPF